MGYMKDLATQIEEALRTGDYMLAYELLEPFQDHAPLQLWAIVENMADTQAEGYKSKGEN
jgi:hypothetical protein